MKVVLFGTDLPIWLVIILIIIMVGIVVYSFNFIMRKVFNLNKEDLNETKHVNDLHKIINRWLFVVFIALLFVGITVNTIRESLEPIFLLEPHILAFELIYATQIVQIFMEWKHLENRNIYLFRIVELIFYTILLLVGYKLFVVDNILNFTMWT